jgi:hypothetical protein
VEKEDLTHKVIGCAYQVYNQLGFGFLESVYRKAMAIEIEASGLRVQQEIPLKVRYRDQVVGDFFADLPRRFTLREADAWFGPLFWSGPTNHHVNPVNPVK